MENIKLKTRAYSINIINSPRDETRITEIQFRTNWEYINMELSLNAEKLHYLFPVGEDMTGHDYTITIERVIREHTPSELLNSAATCVKLGDTKSSIAKITEALQKMAK